MCSGRSDNSAHVELPKGTQASPNKKSNVPQTTYSEKPAEGKAKILRADTEEVPIPLNYNGHLEVANEGVQKIKVEEYLRGSQHSNGSHKATSDADDVKAK